MICSSAVRPRAIDSLRSEMRVCACSSAVEHRVRGHQHTDADDRRHQHLHEREAALVAQAAADALQDAHGQVPVGAPFMSTVAFAVAMPVGDELESVAALVVVVVLILPPTATQNV